MANKMKTLYDQGKALMTPEDSEAESMAEKNANVDQYKNATTAKPTLVIAAPAKPSPKDMLSGGGYGSRPGEQRLDAEGNAVATAKPMMYAPPVPDPKVSVQNQMRVEGQEAEDNDEAIRQATDQNMRNMQQQQLMNQPVAFHAEGGKLDKDKINVVGENGPEEIVGDEVIPLDHTENRNPRYEEPEESGAPADFGGRVLPNPTHIKPKWDTEPDDLNQKAPMNMDNAPAQGAGQGQPGEMQTMSAKGKPSPSHPMASIPAPVTSPDKTSAEAFVQGLPGTASPEERSAAAVERPKTIQVPPSGDMKSKSPSPEYDQANAAPVAAPDPNQVLADQHAKVMKAKLDAASKGDMVGLGSAIIAGQTLGTAGPQATPAAEGGQAPTADEASLAPGAAAMPGYAGKARIGAGTPGEMQAKQDYQNKLADLDQKILTASQVHTPEGKQELGYLQSEKSVLQKMNPLGSAANKPGALGKIEHGLGVVGNIAGDRFLGEQAMSNISGSAAGLDKANEEGAANVEQGSKEALIAAQADKASQTPAVKPQEQLAQEKLNAQTKLRQLITQLQDPKLAPEQKAALQQQAEQIYATNPEFRPKPEDQTKQAVGDDGVKQHAQQLDAIAQGAGFTPEQSAAQHAAFDVKPTDSAAIADKKMAEAESVAKLDSSRRDRETARFAADNTRADKKEDKAADTNDKRMDKSYQYNRSRLDKFRKPIDDVNTRFAGMQEELAQNTPMADALMAPKLLTLMTGGQGTGMRMNEAEIARLVGGRSHWETLKADINKWSLNPAKANSITPEQRKEIRSLMTVVGGRLQKQLSVLDDSNDKLTNATTPEEHRKVVDETQSRLSRAAAGKVKVQLPGHPAADIPETQVDQFRKDNPTGTVEE